MYKLLDECLTYLCEHQKITAWKKTLRVNDYAALDDLIARVAAKTPKSTLVRFVNKGTCNLGNALEAYRISNAWRVLVMCQVLGCSDTTYRRLIRGKGKPSEKTRLRIVNIIGEILP